MHIEKKTTCIIGDIHGCVTALTDLLELVVPRADTIIFLGDFVDRGPHSKEVIDAVIALGKTHPNVIALMGNHDWLFLQYLNGSDKDFFLQVGGLPTLRSYGLSPSSCGDDILRHVPSTHRVFLNSLPLWWEDQHGIYVHAGLQPGRHLSQQTQQWCLWARENFIESTHDFGKTVVFGHTAFDRPHIRPNMIGIDTGAVYGGNLTALLLPAREFVSVPGPQTVY